MSTDIITIHTKNVISPNTSKLLSILESNFDLDVVEVKRNTYAIRAIHPLEVVISSISSTMLQKFVLEPIINPVLEKFDWKKALTKYRNKFEPFAILITLSGDNVQIDSDELLLHKHIENIWIYIHQTIALLKKENLYSQITRIRFVSEKFNELKAVCHASGRPTYWINLDEMKINPIDPASSHGYDVVEDIEEAQERKHTRYNEYKDWVTKQSNDF